MDFVGSVRDAVARFGLMAMVAKIVAGAAEVGDTAAIGTLAEGMGKDIVAITDNGTFTRAMGDVQTLVVGIVMEAQLLGFSQEASEEAAADFLALLDLSIAVASGVGIGEDETF